MLNLRTVDIDKFQLPESSVGLLADYLYVLIQIPNSERVRRIAAQGNIDSSDIPSEESLNTRKDELEDSMKSTRNIFSAISA